MVGKTHDKRHWAIELAKLRKIKTWQLLVILLLVSLLAATCLRLNNLGMVTRRDAVMAADKAGDQQAIKSALVDLQSYVSHHMNTDLGQGVYLTESYERDRAAAIDKAQSAKDAAGQAYRQADQECKQRFTGGVGSFRNDYVQCVINKTAGLEAANDKLKLPQSELYRYDFASPRWSLDLAGLLVAIVALIILIIIVRTISVLILNLLLRRHFTAV
ncbi:MAG TPA: hypothetical protein VFG56_01855 [Candidatus Saccharimonadales bacterium]|nr:hypothetical protein [Candidatus Saccharimonadales bacterium]